MYPGTCKENTQSIYNLGASPPFFSTGFCLERAASALISARDKDFRHPGNCVILISTFSVMSDILINLA
uniref:Uncharacterized protein n=1 Tax=Arundo donax TaxID=35708 RepID=A0A0A9DDK2_ARUDO